MTRKDLYAAKWGAYPGKLAIVPGCPSSGASATAAAASNAALENPAAAAAVGHTAASPKAGSDGCNEDEWKNVHVVKKYLLHFTNLI